ncbi:hypothetical protein VTK56DRAFT_7629 [Thermocarpiscus australiensis]
MPVGTGCSRPRTYGMQQAKVSCGAANKVEAVQRSTEMGRPHRALACSEGLSRGHNTDAKLMGQITWRSSSFACQSEPKVGIQAARLRITVTRAGLVCEVPEHRATGGLLLLFPFLLYWTLEAGMGGLGTRPGSEFLHKEGLVLFAALARNQN